jgi:hypothetical protein
MLAKLEEQSFPLCLAIARIPAERAPSAFGLARWLLTSLADSGRHM